MSGVCQRSWEEEDMTLLIACACSGTTRGAQKEAQVMECVWATLPLRLSKSVAMPCSQLVVSRHPCLGDRSVPCSRPMARPQPEPADPRRHGGHVCISAPARTAGLILCKSCVALLISTAVRPHAAPTMIRYASCASTTQRRLSQASLRSSKHSMMLKFPCSRSVFFRAEFLIRHGQ